MFNPWVILAAVLTIAGLTGGAYIKGRQDGTKLERVTWEARDNKALREAREMIDRLTAEALAKERASAAEMADIAAKHSKEKQDAEAKRRRDVAAARDGSLVLRVPTTCNSPGGGSAGPVAPAPGGSDGGATTELPREVTGDLLTLVNDADEVVRQLTACQAVVRSDRK